MALYDIVKTDILKNKAIKDSGKYVGIPIPFPRLSEYVPIIERGHSIGILGATGSGKSRFTRWMFIYHVYKFYKETGYPVKILYFPLEDSKEKVYRNLICHYLHEIFGTFINLQELDSKGKRNLPEHVVDQLEKAEEFFAEFESVVSILDGFNEPTELYNYCQKYAERTGKVETYLMDVDGEKLEQTRYIPNDGTHTIVIADNMSNIDIEKGDRGEREAIVRFCKVYARGQLCNYYHFTVVQVLQQDFASERQSFTRDGDSIIGKLEPSLAGIGEAKTISRSMHLVLGIFHPSRFGLLQYPIPNKHDPQNTYRLDILGNRFRSLTVLKANDTDFGMKLAFQFDAVTEVMTELPLPKTPELEGVYDKIRQKHPERFSKIKSINGPIIKEDETDLPF
jgi:hypothetical protein